MRNKLHQLPYIVCEGKNSDEFRAVMLSVIVKNIFGYVDNYNKHQQKDPLLDKINWNVC